MNFRGPKAHPNRVEKPPRHSLCYTTACALGVGQVGNLRGGWLPPPVRCERGSGPIANRPQLTKLSAMGLRPTEVHENLLDRRPVRV